MDRSNSMERTGSRDSFGLDNISFCNLNDVKVEEDQGIKYEAEFKIKVVLANPTLALKVAGLFFLHAATFGQKSDCKFKANQLLFDACSLYFQSKIKHKGCEIISASRNMVAKRDNDDQTDPSYEGICCAFRADLAKSYFRGARGIEEKGKALREGAKSSVNEHQKAYQRFNARKSPLSPAQELEKLLPAQLSTTMDHLMAHPQIKDSKNEKILEYKDNLLQNFNDLGAQLSELYGSDEYEFWCGDQDCKIYLNPQKDTGGPNDKMMVEELSHAPAGFYAVDIDTGNGQHAISVIIEKNDDDPFEEHKYYIQDPNIGLIKCPSQEIFQDVFLSILKNYPDPPEKDQVAKGSGEKLERCHNIKCFKINKKTSQQISKEATSARASFQQVEGG